MSDISEELTKLHFRVNELEKLIHDIKRAKVAADRPSAVDALEAWIIAEQLHTVNGNCQQTSDAFVHARELRSRALEAI